MSKNWGQCSWCLFYNCTCFLITSFHCQPQITVQYMSYCLWSALTTVTAPQPVATCTFVNWPDSILFLNVWVMLQLLKSLKSLLFSTIWCIGGQQVIYKHKITSTNGNRRWKPAFSEYPLSILTLDM